MAALVGLAIVTTGAYFLFGKRTAQVVGVVGLVVVFLILIGS